jgi:predicted enzyme related to lactoylglutathione lyase
MAFASQGLRSVLNMAIYFEIQADQNDRALHFYTGVFGWKFTKADGTPVEYWRIETGDGGRGGLLKRPAASPPSHCGANAYVCSFEVTNYDHAADAILKLGGTNALPKFAVPGVCWQGYFLDTEGNTFGVFQPDSKAGTSLGSLTVI